MDLAEGYGISNSVWMGGLQRIPRPVCIPFIRQKYIIGYRSALPLIRFTPGEAITRRAREAARRSIR